jgi:hypothetical protein
MATDETPVPPRFCLRSAARPEHRERLRDLRLRNEEAQRLDVLRLGESRRDVPQGLERADHRPRADEEHEGERHRMTTRYWGAAPLAASLSARPPARSVAVTCSPAWRSAGMMPNNSPAPSEMTSENSRTVPSMAI